MENKPELKMRAGALLLTVWKNKGEKDSEFKTFTLSRTYKNKNGEWKTTGNFRMSDIPKAIALLRTAYEKELVKVINTEGLTVKGGSYD